jgi:hypothetical protein
MSIIGPIVDVAVTQITATILPAVLVIMGSFTALILAVYGSLHVYAMFTGASSQSVFYKMGKIFGSEIRDSEYREFKKKRDKSERQRDFQDRYVKENFNTLYDKGRLRKGRDFY